MANIGVQLMMVKNEIGDQGMYPVLERIAELGYRSVEVSQVATDEAGQSTVTVAVPLRNSRRMGASRLGGSCIGTKPPNGSDAATRNGRQDNSGGSMPRSRIQRRSWLALIPLAMATPATEAPGSPQASIRDCLNASEWVRRVRRGLVTFMKVSTSSA